MQDVGWQAPWSGPRTHYGWEPVYRTPLAARGPGSQGAELFGQLSKAGDAPTSHQQCAAAASTRASFRAFEAPGAEKEQIARARENGVAA